MTEALLARMSAPLGAAVLIAVVLFLLRRRPAIKRLLGPPVTLAAVGNLLLVAFLWTRQVDFPLNLDLMEGTVLQHVQRAAAGVPIYAAPSAAFVALAYNPLYYEVAAASIEITRSMGSPRPVTRPTAAATS